MKVKFLQNAKGSENGYVVKQFLKGQQYIITERLACQFFNMGVIEQVAEDKSPVAELKVEEPAKENKKTTKRKKWSKKNED